MDKINDIMVYYLINYISSIIPCCYHFYSHCTYALIYVETIADYFRMYIWPVFCNSNAFLWFM